MAGKKEGIFIGIMEVQDFPFFARLTDMQLIGDFAHTKFKSRKINALKSKATMARVSRKPQQLTVHLYAGKKEIARLSYVPMPAFA